MIVYANQYFGFEKSQSTNIGEVIKYSEKNRRLQ